MFSSLVRRRVWEKGTFRTIPTKMKSCESIIKEKKPLKESSIQAVKKIFTQFEQIVFYSWPRKDFLVQIDVILCLLLLGAVRAVNLYIPIYNKYIGENAKKFHIY